MFYFLVIGVVHSFGLVCDCVILVHLPVSVHENFWLNVRSYLWPSFPVISLWTFCFQLLCVSGHFLSTFNGLGCVCQLVTNSRCKLNRNIYYNEIFITIPSFLCIIKLFDDNDMMVIFHITVSVTR